MEYEINVSRDGKHVFATHPRSLSGNDEKAIGLARQFRKLFPACLVELTRYEPKTGTKISF